MQTGIGRRGFLKRTAMAGTLAMYGVVAARAQVTGPQPDILIVMPDQMRGDCLSALGHPVVHTASFDALAEQGVLFRRAYTPVASCIPARYALLTGRSPQHSGVVGFAAKPFTTPSMPGLLAEAGYATVLVGRNMHQVPASKSCGYERRILGSTYVGNDDYDTFLQQAAPETGGIRKLVATLGVTYNHWQAKPWPLDEALHPTSWIVEQSRRIVRESDPAKPLFLTSSFYAPHPPLFPPKRYFDACAASRLPPTAHGDWVTWDRLSPKGDGSGHRVLLEGETLHAAQAGYFGLIEQLDAAVGPLIAEFKARSEKAGRPWVIVVTSDHGEMLGDHGFFRKCEPYEGSANIPFIVSGSPSLGFKAGRRLVRPVTLHDIMPTLLSLAGVAVPRGVDGINLLAALRGETTAIRDWLHFEHSPCYSQAQAYHALTDGRYKYIWRPLDGSEQLFDLDADPREEHDLSCDATAVAVIETWRATLAKRLADRPEGFSQGGRLIAGRPYKPLNKGVNGAA